MNMMENTSISEKAGKHTKISRRRMSNENFFKCIFRMNFGH